MGRRVSGLRSGAAQGILHAGACGRSGFPRAHSAPPFEFCAGAVAIALPGRFGGADGSVRQYGDASMPLEPQIVQAPAPVYRWYHKTAALLLIVFCLEIGVVLLVFPWSDYWDNNFFSTWIPKLHDFWDNSYVRGAVSGLGIA